MVMEELSIYLYKLTKLLIIVLLSLAAYYLINIGNNYVDKDKRITIDKKLILPVLGGFFLLFVFYKMFKKYDILSDTFYTIIFSIVIAYLLNPIVMFLERKGLKNRIVSVLLIYLVLIGIIIIFAFLIIPRSAREIKSFAKNMPIYMDRFTDFTDKVSSNYKEITGDIPFISENLKKTLGSSLTGLEEVISSWIRSFINLLYNMFSKVIGLVLTPILTLYFLVDKEKFIGKFFSLIPKKYLSDLKGLFNEIDDSLSKFVRGRLIMAIYVGISITLVLLVLRVDFAIPIGFITGFADIIPYIGPFLGLVPAVFFALLESPAKAMWVIILFLLIQWSENNIIAPKAIGESTGLHPLVVLLAIIIGGGMFGVLGMIFSVPIIAVGIILYKFIMEKISGRIRE